MCGHWSPSPSYWGWDRTITGVQFKANPRNTVKPEGERKREQKKGEGKEKGREERRERRERGTVIISFDQVLTSEASSWSHFTLFFFLYSLMYRREKSLLSSWRQGKYKAENNIIILSTIRVCVYSTEKIKEALRPVGVPSPSRCPFLGLISTFAAKLHRCAGFLSNNSFHIITATASSIVCFLSKGMAILYNLAQRENWLK